MKFLKKLLIAIMVAVTALSASGCVLFEKILDYFSGPPMEKRVYERMDEVGFDKLLSEIYMLLESDGNRNQVVTKRNELFTSYYLKAFTMMTVSSINNDKDVNNTYWQEESIYSMQFAQKVQNSVLALEKAIISSPYYGEYFIENLGQEYADRLLNTEVDSEHQLELLNQISEMETMYSSLYAQEKYDEIDELYINLVKTRNAYARTKMKDDGEYYDNYLDYSYAEVFGREYTPDDVALFRNAIKENIIPLRDRIKPQTEKPGVDAPLSATDILTVMPQIIDATAPDMISSWNYMTKRNLYDFDLSETKANTSYVTEFYQYNDAFMFINASGYLTRDLSTVIHEFGHYNEVFMANEDLEGDNSMSYDLAETHSQAFELITLPAVENLIATNYSNVENLYENYVVDMLYNSTWALLSNCIFDEFEYVVYNADQSALTAEFLDQQFSDIWNKYWDGNQRNYYDVPHIVQISGYCISYVVSLVFASEIWACETPIETYLKVVEYGTGNYLSTVYQAVELDNPLLPETVKKIADSYNSYIDEKFDW